MIKTIISKHLYLITICLVIQSVVMINNSYAKGDQEVSLELLDESDADLLLDFENERDKENYKGEKLSVSEAEEIDDLESLKQDIGDLLFDDDKKTGKILKRKSNKHKKIPRKVLSKKEDHSLKSKKSKDAPVLFDIGEEEKNLLLLSKFIEGKILDSEWNEIAVRSKKEKYVVQKGEWLWKIAKELFGSGFYYAKIWALNPHITNPHEIEPGTVLVFDTGDLDSIPSVRVGSFSGVGNLKNKSQAIKGMHDFAAFGDDSKPEWLEERERLINQGVFFQYASDETYDDLIAIGKKSLNFEYEKYEPPIASIIIKEPGKEYDDTGFDKDSKIVYEYSDGFFLSTFVTTNIVQDLGFISAARHEPVTLTTHDIVYVNFDKSVVVRPGDKFSVYTAEGKVSHKVSDREGYKYTITAEIEAQKKINHLWECKITDTSAITRRNDRITIHTPKITQISKTFNKRNIEAAIINTYKDSIVGASLGDVVYLDRGRADGVEIGNVFELYSFHDRSTGKRITPDPTYKVGEVTVITLTDNFATGLITNSKADFGVGTLGITKSAEQAMIAERNRSENKIAGVKKLEEDALEELDVELNLDDYSKDLLDKVDKIKLTEDELEELERQEKDHSVIKKHEKDITELDRLEREIEEAENRNSELKKDEDKLLEGESLENIEGRAKGPSSNAFESINEVERGVGLKYMDEDLNSKENPYGLTDFDLEEIDELLNTDL